MLVLSIFRQKLANLDKHRIEAISNNEFCIQGVVFNSIQE